MRKTIIRRLLLAVTALLMIHTAQAQVNWQVRVGMGVSDLLGFKSMNERFSYRFGVEADVPLGTMGWGIQPGLYYAHKGTEFLGIYEKEQMYVGIFQNRMNYMEMPIYATYKQYVWDDLSLKFKAGGYVAYGMNGSAYIHVPGTEYSHMTVFGDLFKDGCNYENSSGSLGEDVADYFYSPPYKRVDAGIAAGIDVEYHGFILGAEAQLGLVPVVKQLYRFGFFENPKLRNFTAYVSVGYQF